MRLTIALAITVLALASARADIICTHNGGCFETGRTIISNGGVYRGLEHKPRILNGKMVKPDTARIRYYE
jgi:hypothetical protein